ncbi:unnamed protein product [Absidia cylindrospora]
MTQETTSTPPPPPPLSSSSSSQQQQQQQQQQQHHHRRNGLVERCSTLRACDPCKRKKRVCNGQRPCSHCIEGGGGGGGKKTSSSCVYSVVPDHARGVFTTTTARRLSSGSACETCRRRKTKCDGASPCGYCASNQLECVNHSSERRKRLSLANIAKPNNNPINNNNTTIGAPTTSSPPSNHLTTTTSTFHNPPLFSSPLSHSTTTTTTTTTNTTGTAGGVPTTSNENEAMDRIEDRLQRIEKLMSAFSSETSSSSSSPTNNIYRKLSTPQYHTFGTGPTTTATNLTQYVRPHRHSVQGIAVAKEQVELRTALAMSRTKVGTSPPPLTSSMVNLTLSPSSSSTSSEDDLTMPSFMDQLSKRTFTSHSAMDYCTVHYPIYPLTPPPPSSQ